MSAAYVGLPPLAYLLRYRVVAPMYLFAGDAFYYLDVARHSVGFPGFSFDGEHPTNGFHPLWEYLLVALAKLHLVDYSQSSAALIPVFLLNLILLTVGSAMFCMFGSRLLRYPMLALLAAAPGLLWIGAAPINPTYLTTWSFLNGMESSSAMVCFACALLLIRERFMSLSRTAWVSVFLGLGVLARLDDVFIALPVTALLLWRTPSPRRLRHVIAHAPLFLLLFCYLFYNRSSVGVFLPISGATKAGLAFGANLRWTLRLFLPVVTGDGPTVLLPRPMAYFGFAELGGRLVQMLLPAAICAIELSRTVRERTTTKAGFHILHACALGVILKGCYNFAFVQSWAQGPWYYSVSVAIANLILLLWLSRLFDVVSLRVDLRRWRPVLLLAHAALVLLAFNVFISHRNAAGPVGEVMLLTDNQPVRSKLKSLGATRVLEFDDGFTSFVANVPSAAGLGLALDSKGAEAIRSGHFLDLVYRRGYRIAVANGAYADQIDDAIQAQHDGARPRIAELQASELDAYLLRPLGGDGSADLLKYYELVPKSTDAVLQPPVHP